MSSALVVMLSVGWSEGSLGSIGVVLLGAHCLTALCSPALLDHCPQQAAGSHGQISSFSHWSKHQHSVGWQPIGAL